MTNTIKTRTGNNHPRTAAAVLLLASTAVQAMDAAAADRETWVALASDPGTTTTIPEARVVELCYDQDGCSVRLGLRDYDTTGDVALKEFLFYYNGDTRHWRTDGAVHKRGRNGDNKAETIMVNWFCYFTDALYFAGSHNGDFIDDTAFGIVKLQDKYPGADCQLTLID